MSELRCSWRLLPYLAACVLAACAGPPSRTCPVPPGQAAEPIYVVSHGWHAGLVLPSRAPALADWPLASGPRVAEQVEVGWGDRDFYMASEPGWWLAAEAVLLPNESVLHVVWLDAPVEALFPGSEILEIRLSVTGLQRLSQHIGSSVARNEHDAGIDLGAGLYGDGRFYLSRERYHAFNTCNVWVAKALREAGCPISPALALSVDELLQRVRPFAMQVQAAGAR
jgi:uncharacterized protein (TIGR02117 family)